MNRFIFPIILILMDLMAAIVYICYGDKVRFAYWLLAGGITATTLWMK